MVHMNFDEVYYNKQLFNYVYVLNKIANSSEFSVLVITGDLLDAILIHVVHFVHCILQFCLYPQTSDITLVVDLRLLSCCIRSILII